MSLAEALVARLGQLVDLLDELLDASSIARPPLFPPRLRVFEPDSSWGPLDDRQRQLQREILELWRPWFAQVTLLFSSDTKERQQSVAGSAERIRRWIERDKTDWTVPSTIREAREILRKHARPLFDALRALSSSADSVVLVVPDTNVLLRSPDVTRYGDVLGTKAYTVVLVPGVMTELDQQKINHRNEAVRDRARKLTYRIKGWRAQGDLSQGVKVEGSVWVRVEGREPDLSRTLPWLDKDIVDDRILASVVELQRRHPGARIVLLTGDTGMLAKADAASVPTADTPEPDVGSS